MEKFYIKQNDTSPDIQATLVNGDGSRPNLTGQSMFFLMSAGHVNKVNAQATLVDAVNGVVKYEWQTGDTDTPGNYLAEFKSATGGTRTWPNAKANQINVIVTEEIA